MVLLLGTEDEAPGVGVESVGADDEVEGALRPAAEDHVHAAFVVMEGGDGVAEEELDLVAHGFVKQVGQVPPAHFHVTAFHSPGEHLGPDGTQGSAVGPHEGDPAAVDVGGAELGQRAHPVDDVQRRAADVDGVPTAAHRARLLHDGDLEAVPLEPVGQRGPRDAGTGDEDLPLRRPVRRPAHERSPLGRAAESLSAYLRYLYWRRGKPLAKPRQGKLYT